MLSHMELPADPLASSATPPSPLQGRERSVGTPQARVPTHPRSQGANEVVSRARETPSTSNRDRESLQLPRRRRIVPAPHLPEEQREVDPPVLVALPEPERVRLVVQRAVEDDDPVL